MITFGDVDPTAVMLHCLAGGLSHDAAKGVIENLRGAFGFGYHNDICVCWSPMPVVVDSDGMLTRNLAADAPCAHVWHCYHDNSGGWGTKAPNPHAKIVLLRTRAGNNSDKPGFVRMELIPFTIPEVSHEA